MLHGGVGGLREAGQERSAAGSLGRDTQEQSNGTGPPGLGEVLRAGGRIEDNDDHSSPYPPTRAGLTPLGEMCNAEKKQIHGCGVKIIGLASGVQMYADRGRLDFGWRPHNAIYR